MIYTSISEYVCAVISGYRKKEKIRSKMTREGISYLHATEELNMYATMREFWLLYEKVAVWVVMIWRIIASIAGIIAVFAMCAVDSEGEIGWFFIKLLFLSLFICVIAIIKAEHHVLRFDFAEEQIKHCDNLL